MTSLFSRETSVPVWVLVKKRAAFAAHDQKVLLEDRDKTLANLCGQPAFNDRGASTNAAATVSRARIVTNLSSGMIPPIMRPTESEPVEEPERLSR